MRRCIGAPSISDPDAPAHLALERDSLGHKRERLADPGAGIIAEGRRQDVAVSQVEPQTFLAFVEVDHELFLTLVAQLLDHERGR